MIVSLLVVLVAFSPLTNGDITRYAFEKNNPHPNAKYFDNTRIVGGVDAPRGIGEHMASLVYGYGWMTFICGGSIIGPHTILTAAHCIDVMRTWDQVLLTSFRAIIGSYRWDRGSDREFSGYAIHSGWNWDTIKNDIGILRVSKEMQPSNVVAIMPISFDRVDGNVQCHVTGWGLQADMETIPERLQMLNVTTMKHWECTTRMDQANVAGDRMPKISDHLEICALHSYGHGMCNGDSGSGLILGSIMKLVGIVSWGMPCAKGAPDVYTRVSAFDEWIRKVGVY